LGFAILSIKVKVTHTQVSGEMRHKLGISTGSLIFLLAAQIPAHAAGYVAPAADQPASFDCSRAPGVDERLICSDPLLRRVDFELGVQYRQLLKDTRDRGRVAAIRSDERSWVLRRNAECAVYRTLIITPDERMGYVDCFLASYDERGQDLMLIRDHPSTDPTAISTPIRRSLYGAQERYASLPASGLVATRLFAASAEDGQMDFRPDGTLVVLGSTRQATPGAGLYEWSHGQMSAISLGSETLPRNARGARVCVDEASTAIIPTAELSHTIIIDSHGSQSIQNSTSGASVSIRCGLNPERRQIGAGVIDNSIDLGPVGSDTTNISDRFVSLIGGGGTQTTDPPIRIDGRIMLRATFDQYTRTFIVQPALPPKDIADETLRRWAKFDCEVYWSVNATSARANRGCLPYGTYSTAPVTVLPTHAGTYFAGASGLFRLDASDQVEQVLRLPIIAPVVSPDGCKIAFISGASDGREVQVADVCR
jgi:uncharacterized protein YecT (DUF1311 family)